MRKPIVASAKALTYIVLLSSFASISWAQATTGIVVWANNASFRDTHLQAYDLTTGNLVVDFAAPHKDAHNGNERGIAVNGRTIYYSFANSGKVYMADLMTHADIGNGTYKYQFSNVFPNAHNITVKSSLGGSATSPVVTK